MAQGPSGPKKGHLVGSWGAPHTPRVAHTQRPAQAPASHCAGPMLRKRRPTPKCSRCKVRAQNGKTRELPTNPHTSGLGAKLFLQKALPAPIPNFHRTHEPRSDPGPRLCSWNPVGHSSCWLRLTEARTGSDREKHWIFSIYTLPLVCTPSPACSSQGRIMVYSVPAVLIKSGKSSLVLSEHE